MCLCTCMCDQHQVFLSTYSGLETSFHQLPSSSTHLSESLAALVGLLGAQNIPQNIVSKIVTLLHGLGGRGTKDML